MHKGSTRTLKKNSHRRGFTIVELLVVVVIIAILAAITVVAFNGITGQAIETSMKSDLRTAATTLELDNTRGGSYPADSGSANNGQGLKSSNNNTLSYKLKTYGYCLTITNPRINEQMHIRGDSGAIENSPCPTDVTTFAGSGAEGFADGTGTAAQFGYAHSIVAGPSGTIYVADSSNHRIRKITAAGVVTTLAGSGATGYADGTGAAAVLNSPRALAIGSGETIYFFDFSRIRKVTSDGAVTTLAGSAVTGSTWDGTGTEARFNSVSATVVDASGNVYAGDSSKIRKITPSGVVTTLVGSDTAGQANGTGVSARFNSVRGLAIDGLGNLYASDYIEDLSGDDPRVDAGTIRKISPGGVVTTIAGSPAGGYADGVGTVAKFGSLSAITIDPAGSLFVVDNTRVRKITSAGVVSTVAGSGDSGYSDGTGNAVIFNSLVGITYAPSGDIFLVDLWDKRIRKIEL